MENFVLAINCFIDIWIFFLKFHHGNSIIIAMFLDFLSNISKHLILISLDFSTFSSFLITLLEHWRHTSLFPVSLGVEVLLLDESLSSLHGFSSDIVSSLWEKVTQPSQLLLVDTHENDIWKSLVIDLLSILAFAWLSWIWVILQSFDNNVWLKLLKDLVISKITKFRQVKNRSFLHDFIIVIVVNLNDTLSDEVNFLDITLVADDNSSRSI